MGVQVYVDTVTFEPAEKEKWMARATCVNRDPQIFFSEGKGTVKAQTDAAKKICNEICTVRIECLARTMHQEKDTYRRFGVSGGLTPTERELLQMKLDQLQEQQEEENNEQA